MKTQQYDKNLSYVIIKYRYNSGVFTIKDMLNFVEMNIITKDEFKSITSYDYDGYYQVHKLDKK